MAFDRVAAKKAGYTDQEIDAYLKSKSASVSPEPKKSGGLVGDLFGIKNTDTTSNETLGGGNFLADMLFPRASEISKRQASGGQGAQSIDEILGLLGETASNVLPFAGPGGLAMRLGLAGATHGLTETGANPVERIKSGAIEGGVGYGLGKAGSLFKQYGTKKGVAGLTEKAAKKSPKKGVEFTNLSKQIEKEAFDKLGETAEVRNSIKKVLAELAPANVSNPSPGMFNEPSKFNPTKLLTTRRQMGARSGGNWIKKALMGSDIEDKVTNIARRVISDNLHKVAPGTKLPDMLYNFYSKGGPLVSGGVPTKLIKLMAAMGIGKYGLSSMLRSAAGD